MTILCLCMTIASAVLPLIKLKYADNVNTCIIMLLLSKAYLVFLGKSSCLEQLI